MNHYICTGGCEGVAEKPGNCQAIACPKYDKPLIECDCTDGKHAEVIHNTPPESSPAQQDEQE